MCHERWALHVVIIRKFFFTFFKLIVIEINLHTKYTYTLFAKIRIATGLSIKLQLCIAFAHQSRPIGIATKQLTAEQKRRIKLYAITRTVQYCKQVGCYNVSDFDYIRLYFEPIFVRSA